MHNFFLALVRPQAALLLFAIIVTLFGYVLPMEWQGTRRYYGIAYILLLVVLIIAWFLQVAG